MDHATDIHIPLLTEVIAGPPAELNATNRDQQLQQIRQDVYENVMQTLLAQVDLVLHQHLQDHLAVVLDNMADMLKVRVRASLEETTVKDAVAVEMMRFENSKK